MLSSTCQKASVYSYLVSHLSTHCCRAYGFKSLQTLITCQAMILQIVLKAIAGCKHLPTCKAFAQIHVTRCEIAASAEPGTVLNAAETFTNLSSEAASATLRSLCDRLAARATSAILYGKATTVDLALQSLLVSKVLCAQHCRHAFSELLSSSYNKSEALLTGRISYW